MPLSRHLLLRAAPFAALSLIVATLFALATAAGDIRSEWRGADATARMFRHLAGLQADHAETRDGHLRALRDIAASGALRHLRLTLRDDRGVVLVPQAGTAGSAAPAGPAASWTIPAAEGAAYRVALDWNPRSEESEALNAFAGQLATLMLYSALLFAGIAWAARRALAPLRGMLAAIRRYEHAEYDAALPETRIAELDAIRRALQQLAAALAQAEASRRALSLRLLDAQEHERARIARELHDELGQTLTAMRADAAYLSRRLTHDAALRGVADGLSQHGARIQQDVRSLLHRLRPHGTQPGNGPVPLARMLQDLLQGWRTQPDSRTDFRLEIELGAVAVPPALALALYRMTQEALTNAVRHAGAGTVQARVAANAAGDIVWCVEDDGRGIADLGAALEAGCGLGGMRERVWAHGGELELGASRPGETRPGLKLLARFPGALSAAPAGVATISMGAAVAAVAAVHAPDTPAHAGGHGCMPELA